MVIEKKKTINDILEKASLGNRILPDEGISLFNSDEIHQIGQTANIIREKVSGRDTYFIVNRHINYTNICENRCKFCAFSCDKGEDGAYEMDVKYIVDSLRENVENGATEVHIVGGLNPDLSFSFYIDMLRLIKKSYPNLHIQAFTAVEIAYIAQIASLSIEDTLIQLREAGLGSLPGGGAEVFSKRIRKELCKKKISSEEWLSIHRQAHKIGIRSNATMLYGHIEDYKERIYHLEQLRRLQDETNGFMSFIPLPFHPKNTEFSHIQRTSPLDDLKTIAIARIYLDNFPHIKSFWIMLGVRLAQLSLYYGADDLDGTVVEEKITHSAGANTPEYITKTEMINLILEAGRVPVERDTLYNKLSIFWKEFQQ